MSDGGVRGGLPAGWAEVRLVDVCAVLDSHRIPINSAERKKRRGPYPYYGANGQVGTIDDFLFDGEHVLLAEDGGHFDRPGRGVAYRVSGQFWVNNHAHILRPLAGVPASLIVHQLNRLDWRGRVSGTTRLKLTQASMREVPLRVPPLAEQQRIVEELDLQLGRVAQAEVALRRVQKTIKRARDAVLQAACEGRLVPTEAELAKSEGRPYEDGSALLKRVLEERRRCWEERELARLIAAGKEPTDGDWKERYKPPAKIDGELPEVPEGWCVAAVDEVCDVLLGRQLAPQYSTGTFSRPYLRVANVSESGIDFSDVKVMDFDTQDFVRYHLQPGDILLAEGQSPELVGESAIYRGGVDGLCFQKTLHRVRPFSTGPGSEFLWLVFRHYLRAGIFRRRASLTVNIAHLTLERLKPIPLPLPPLAEQQRIVAAVEERFAALDQLARTVEANLKRCEKLRHSLLQMAFEGRLVPQDPNDEPASALLARIRAARAAREEEQRRQRAASRTTKASPGKPPRLASKREAAAPADGGGQLPLRGLTDAPRATKRARPRKTR